MIIRKLDDAEIMENAHNVDARNLYNKPEAVVTIISLKPEQNLKRHITPVDVVFYVLKGRGVVEVGEEKKEVSEGSLIESPKDIVHCWHNTSNEILQFMVIKTPKPDKKTIFVGD